MTEKEMTEMLDKLSKGQMPREKAPKHLQEAANHAEMITKMITSHGDMYGATSVGALATMAVMVALKAMHKHRCGEDNDEMCRGAK